MFLAIHVEEHHVIKTFDSEKEARAYVEEQASYYYNKAKTFQIAKVIRTNAPAREWS